MSLTYDLEIPNDLKNDIAYCQKCIEIYSKYHADWNRILGTCYEYQKTPLQALIQNLETEISQAANNQISLFERVRFIMHQYNMKKPWSTVSEQMSIDYVKFQIYAYAQANTKLTPINVPMLPDESVINCRFRSLFARMQFRKQDKLPNELPNAFKMSLPRSLHSEVTTHKVEPKRIIISGPPAPPTNVVLVPRRQSVCSDKVKQRLNLREALENAKRKRCIVQCIPTDDESDCEEPSRVPNPCISPLNNSTSPKIEPLKSTQTQDATTLSTTIKDVVHPKIPSPALSANPAINVEGASSDSSVEVSVPNPSPEDQPNATRFFDTLGLTTHQNSLEISTRLITRKRRHTTVSKTAATKDLTLVEKNNVKQRRPRLYIPAEKGDATNSVELQEFRDEFPFSCVVCRKDGEDQCAFCFGFYHLRCHEDNLIDKPSDKRKASLCPECIRLKNN